MPQNTIKNGHPISHSFKQLAILLLCVFETGLAGGPLNRELVCFPVWLHTFLHFRQNPILRLWLTADQLKPSNCELASD